MQGQIKRENPNTYQCALNEKLIIDMAKTLMREMHVTPSIRGVALALNVDTVEINQYFNSKINLLSAILVSLMDSLYISKEHTDWQQSLCLLSASYLDLLKNYNGLLEVLISMPSNGPMSRFFSLFNEITAPLNLPPEKQKNAFLLLLNFLHGLALLPPKEREKNDIDALLAMYCKIIES